MDTFDDLPDFDAEPHIDIGKATSRLKDEHIDEIRYFNPERGDDPNKVLKFSETIDTIEYGPLSGKTTRKRVSCVLGDGTHVTKREEVMGQCHLYQVGKRNPKRCGPLSVKSALRCTICGWLVCPDHALIKRLNNQTNYVYCKSCLNKRWWWKMKRYALWGVASPLLLIISPLLLLIWLWKRLFGRKSHGQIQGREHL